MPSKAQEALSTSRPSSKREDATPASAKHLNPNQESAESDSENLSQNRQDVTMEDQDQTHSEEETEPEPPKHETMPPSEATAWQDFGLQQKQLLEEEQQKSSTIQQERDEWMGKYAVLEKRYDALATNANHHMTNRNGQLRSWQARVEQKEQDIRKQSGEFRRYLDHALREKQVEIDKLKNQNSELTDHVYKAVGQVQYATIDQMRSLMEDWYHESANFCPEFFDFPDVNNEEHQSIIQGRKQWQPIKDVSTDLFYYFVQGVVLDSSHISACTYGLSDSNRKDATGKLLWEAMDALDRAIMSQWGEGGDHDLERRIRPVWADTARLIIQDVMKFDLKELGDSSGNSESRGRAIQSCKSLALTVENLEELVLKSLKPYMLSGYSGSIKLTKSAARNLRKLLHSIMFITLNIMVSRKIYTWIKPSGGDDFDPAIMESVGGQESAQKGQVLFTVQYGLRQEDDRGEFGEPVCKARVVLKPKQTWKSKVTSLVS